MRTVAFYSYKGGTGRTLALGNIARFAARIGKRVVAIDMDLEAPGLGYKILTEAQADTRSRGLVGCLLDNIHHGEMPADLTEYLIDVELGFHTEDPALEPVEGGWLKLMPAGVVPSPNYFGDLRILALDARVSSGDAAGLLRTLLDRIQSDFDPDLVLIDARTGITNSNTLVLSELADAAFSFFLDLPEQLDGVRMVLRALAPLTRSNNRPLSLYGVITRVPTDPEHRDAGWIESEADSERKARIERFFTEPSSAIAHTVDKIDLLPLHHLPSLVGRERLLMDLLVDSPDSRSALAFDYHRLAAEVIDDAAAVARAVEPLRLTGDRSHAAIAGLLTGEPSSRSAPSQVADDGGSGAKEPSLRERIAALRTRAERDPAARADLADLLLELAAAEVAIGDHAEAIAPTEEATTINRELAANNPAYLGNLAASLTNLGNRYSEIGRPADAVEPTEEAVTIYRELAANNPAHLGNLATSLNNLGASYSAIGRPADAVEPTEEAVTIYRELAANNPAHLGNLATSLNNLGASYSAIGRPADAVEPTEEAVTIYRELAANNPAHLRSLAKSLNNLGSRYGLIGRRTDAINRTGEALTIYQVLADTNPAFLNDLVGTMNRLSIRYDDDGR